MNAYPGPTDTAQLRAGSDDPLVTSGLFRPERRTKWQILNARRNQLAEELAVLDATLAGMGRTNCGLKCSGCGQWLASEREFAEHFVIPDERYLNLGVCPGRNR